MAKQRQSGERATSEASTASLGRVYWWAMKTPEAVGVRFYHTRIEAVMSAAERSGLLREKSGRIGGRVSPELVEKAKARTGIEADTDLIEFALANLAVEDKFAEAFKAVRGSVDPDLDLGL